MAELTVIIVALLEGAALEASIAAVTPQADRILVVARDGAIRDLGGQSVGHAGTRDVPGRRRAGVELAETDLVALIEDTVIVDAGWADAVCAAFADAGVAAIGGPVHISAALPAPVRALALTEFGAYQGPQGPGGRLPGCNFAFRREALLAAMPDEGLIDGEVVARLLAKGHRLGWATGMSVTYAGAHHEGAALATRFSHGRIYASRLLGSASLPGRLAGAAKAVLLPAVMTARSLGEARAPERKSPATLAWVALQHSAWAAGEFTGALFGPAKGGVGGWQ